VLLLIGCHRGAGHPDPAPCTAGARPPDVPVAADVLAGDYRLQLTSDSGDAAVVGSLQLRPADPSLPPRAGPYGLPDTTNRYPLVGVAEIDLGAVGAVAPGGTRSSDPSAPGVLVIERTGSPPPGEGLLLRLGAEANRAEQLRFDGGYTILRVRQIDQEGFRGDWESGAPLPRARGRFCASRAGAPG
jgi:hypothetical protein